MWATPSPRMKSSRSADPRRAARAFPGGGGASRLAPHAWLPRQPPPPPVTTGRHAAVAALSKERPPGAVAVGAKTIRPSRRRRGRWRVRRGAAPLPLPVAPLCASPSLRALSASCPYPVRPPPTSPRLHSSPAPASPRSDPSSEMRWTGRTAHTTRPISSSSPPFPFRPSRAHLLAGRARSCGVNDTVAAPCPPHIRKELFKNDLIPKLAKIGMFSLRKRVYTRRN